MAKQPVLAHGHEKGVATRDHQSRERPPLQTTRPRSKWQESRALSLDQTSFGLGAIKAITTERRIIDIATRVA